MSLQSMLSGNWFEALATAIPATHAIPEGKEANPKPIIATVAGIAVANPPNSKAENDLVMEISLLDSRLALFMDRGLTGDDAQILAERLTVRDLRGDDDRRVCLECLHLSGTMTSRRCGQWRKLGNKDSAAVVDILDVLQRCVGFQPVHHDRGVTHA